MDQRETETATIWLDDEGIVHVESRGVPSTQETAAKSLLVVSDLVGGRRAPILFDARQWPMGDGPSWAQFISMIGDVCSAGAVLVDGKASPGIDSFSPAIDSLIIPFRVFTDEDAAVSFLRGHLD